MDSLTSLTARKRVLILMADYGYGHRSAADAVAKALRETHGQDCTVEVVNPLDDPRAPALLRTQQANYDRLTREMPDLHDLGYQVSDLPLASNLIESAMTLLLFNVLRKIVRRHRPDVIVSTYLFYPAILSTILAVEKLRIPLVTVVTDLASAHNLWFYPRADLCLVPTQDVFESAVHAGLAPERVVITGIPVDPDLARGRQDLAALRKQLGWRPDLFTVLAVGSKRVEHLYESVQALNHSNLPLQLAVVAGGDDDLFRQLTRTMWRKEATLYNFVPDMASLTRAADCVVGKAGGLTITESLACGLPLVLVDVIPGQETGNAEYVLGEGAADRARDPGEVLDVMERWLADDMAVYQTRAANARRIGRPTAAHDVAEYVFQLSAQGARAVGRRKAPQPAPAG
ncbi:MAG: glycosyltransferase [Anaerolineales bacterium]